MKYFALIIITALTASSVFAESYVRIRGIQASPLLSDNARSEKGNLNLEVMKSLQTPPSKYQSAMISYGIFGSIGTTSMTTNFAIQILKNIGWMMGNKAFFENRKLKRERSYFSYD